MNAIPANDADAQGRLRFSVLDLLAEDEMDLFEVRDVARRAVPGLTEPAFEAALHAVASALLRDRLVTLVRRDGGAVEAGEALPAAPAWRYEALGPATPRLAITPEGRRFYEAPVPPRPAA